MLRRLGLFGACIALAQLSEGAGLGDQVVKDAAAKFATDISQGNTKVFTEIYLRSLKVGINSIGGVTSAKVNGPSLLDDKRYLQNAALLVRPGRIVGFSAEEPRDFPESVAVGDASSWFCSGTLIHPSYVLTAAHCAEGRTISRVFFGANLADLAEAAVVSVTPLPKNTFDPATYRDDLCLLKLRVPISQPHPIALAGAAQVGAATSVRIVGYGTIDFAGLTGFGKRRVGTVPVADPGCDPGSSALYGCFVGRELVAGRPGLGIDTCSGDSGGGAYVDVGGQRFLAGVTSRSTKDSLRNCGDGGVYVRVDAYESWFREVLGR